MIKLKSLLIEVSETKARSYFRKELWDDFTNAARYKKDKHFYNDLVKIVKKSKFYPHAGHDEAVLHGKIVFTKAFDEVRNKRVNLKKYEYDYKGWPKHVKEFIGNMEMFK